MEGIASDEEDRQWQVYGKLSILENMDLRLSIPLTVLVQDQRSDAQVNLYIALREICLLRLLFDLHRIKASGLSTE